MRNRLLISCEHGGNRIPARYRQLFARRKALLRSHRAYDRGALWLARLLAKRLDAPLYSSTVSRLLIDLNRSLHNPRVWSQITKQLDMAERERVIDRYHKPHWAVVEAHCREFVSARIGVVHLAIHTFTPRLGGRTRNADIGLLYDPRRDSERELCVGWQQAIESSAPSLRVRRNYPYRGSADGLTTRLRRQFPGDLYAGIELEINQRLVTRTGTIPYRVCEALVTFF